MESLAAITVRPVEDIEYPTFMSFMFEHARDYLEPSLLLMGIDQAEFELLFRTRGEVRAIEAAGEVAGFYWIEVRDRTLHLHAVIVKPDFQKRGIARAVFEGLEAEFTGKVDAMELGVHRSNSRAKAVYEQAGFRTTRELEEMDFYIMRKALSS